MREAYPPVRRLWRPIRSATVPEAASAGSLVQKLANESVSNFAAGAVVAAGLAGSVGLAGASAGLLVGCG